MFLLLFNFNNYLILIKNDGKRVQVLATLPVARIPIYHDFSSKSNSFPSPPEEVCIYVYSNDTAERERGQKMSKEVKKQVERQTEPTLIPHYLGVLFS